MHDTKERLSLLWIFALLNYLYADVVALFAIAGSRNSFEPLPAWALMGSAVLMEIPIAMILACRLLPFRANRLANMIAGGVVTLVNGFLTFVPPLVGWGRPPAFPEYLFFATIETVATSVIIWQAWTWSGVETHVVTGEKSVFGRRELSDKARSHRSGDRYRHFSSRVDFEMPLLSRR